MEGSPPAAVALASRKEDVGTFQSLAPGKFSLFILFLVFAALLIARRPDCVSNPQFWAEEGSHFFPDALERPAWRNLGSFAYGYFDLFLRSVMQAAAAVPLQYAPLFNAVVAIGIQASVPVFVVSARCQGWMGQFPIRLAAALLYCAMPNSFETHCLQLHSRVHLAVLAALIIVSAPPRSLGGKILDAGTLALSGLSGPFALMLAPAAAWRFWHTPTSAALRNCVVSAAVALPGLFALLSSAGQRSGLQLGASVLDGVRIVGGQFTVGLFLGCSGYKRVLPLPWFDLVAWAGFFGLILIVLLLVRTGPIETRYLLFFGFSSFLAALASPFAAINMPQWHALWSVPGCGQRYYFPLMAMLLFSLAAVIGRGTGRMWRAGAAFCLLLIASMGARTDFVLPPFTDFHFRDHAQLYRSLPAGASLTVPINPPGWEMHLRKPAP